jgi:hypothetical protein
VCARRVWRRALRFRLDDIGDFLDNRHGVAAPPFVQLRELDAASLALERDEDNSTSARPHSNSCGLGQAAHPDHLEALVDQGNANAVAQLGVVFDQQNIHKRWLEPSKLKNP